MQQTDPMPARPVRRFRRTAFGLVAVVVVASGVAAGGEAAFADSASSLAALQSAASDTTSTSYALGENTYGPQATVTVGPKAFTLDLAGNELDLDTLQLSPVGAQLTIIDSSPNRAGKLIVTHTSDSTHAAIEVDSTDSLTIIGAHVEATGSTSTSSVAATIGAGAAGSAPYDSGAITIDGASDVSATASGKGAAIGGGSGGVNAVVTVAPTVDTVDTVVHASTTGSGAAIGSGAIPSGQRPAGGVQILNNAKVYATSGGSGAAVGGGFHGDGGAIEVHGYSSLDAEATNTGEAAIGDGENATGGGSQVTIDGTTHVTAVGGGAGGAGIGGSKNATAYGDRVSITGRAQVHVSAAAGPGIGGLGNTRGGSVDISGAAQVWATGGGAGAGIGAGDGSSYAFGIEVSGDATLTAAGGSATASALGGATAGYSSNISNSGNGSIVIPGGSSWTIPAGATATNDGTITNGGTISVNGAVTNSGAVTSSGTINGTGTLDNEGTIIQNGSLSTKSIIGNNFDVNYDPQSGTASAAEQRVYAPSVSAAGLALPTATPNAVGSFTGWNAATDGTGATLRSGTGITSDFGASGSSDGRPVTVRAYAQYQLSPVLPTSGTLAQGVVGTPYSASVAVTSGTAPISYTYTGSLPAGLQVDAGTGAIKGTPTTMGTFTMHLTATNALASATRDFTIQIVPTPITLSVPTTSKGSSWYLAGATASLRIGNLQTNETYTVKIGGKVAATGKASSNNVFTLKVTIPKSIGDGSQTVEVTGGVHASSATSKILTASVSKALSLKLSAKKVKHGKKVVITISKLYAGESARVVVSGKHGKTAVGKASSKGVYVVTLKSGLAKGKYTVTVTGAGTSRKASAKLTVS